MRDFQYLSYEITDGLHVVTFHEATSNTVDEYMEIIQHLYDRYDESARLPLLVDSRCGTVPMKRMMVELKALNDEYHHRPSFDSAVVVEDSMMRRVIDMMLRAVMRDDKLRFFGTLDAAYTWLKNEIKSGHADKATPEKTTPDTSDSESA
jgi:hypothetical protein